MRARRSSSPCACVSASAVASPGRVEPRPPGSAENGAFDAEEGARRARGFQTSATWRASLRWRCSGRGAIAARSGDFYGGAREFRARRLQHDLDAIGRSAPMTPSKTSDTPMAETKKPTMRVTGVDARAPEPFHQPPGEDQAKKGDEHRQSGGGEDRGIGGESRSGLSRSSPSCRARWRSRPGRTSAAWPAA